MMPIGEWHLCATLKMAAMARKRTRAREGVEERRVRRLAVRTLWIFDFAVRGKGRLPTQHKVLLLKDEVQPSCFAQERV
jgi:hypothetical protein